MRLRGYLPRLRLVALLQIRVPPNSALICTGIALDLQYLWIWVEACVRDDDDALNRSPAIASTQPCALATVSQRRRSVKEKV